MYGQLTIVKFEDAYVLQLVPVLRHESHVDDSSGAHPVLAPASRLRTEQFDIVIANMFPVRDLPHKADL